MKEWVIAVAVSCLILSVMGSFLPEGKIKKYTFGVMKVVVLLIMCSPLINFFNKQEENFFSESEVAITPIQKNFLCSLAENELKKEGIDCLVTVTEEDQEIFVDIYLSESVINEEEGNIYKNSKTVIDVVKKYLNVDSDRIRVWSK